MGARMEGSCSHFSANCFCHSEGHFSKAEKIDRQDDPADQRLPVREAGGPGEFQAADHPRQSLRARTKVPKTIAPSIG